MFENDIACDFGEAVAKGGGASLVGQALNRVRAFDGGDLPASVAEEGLAAVEIVARLSGRPGAQTAYTSSVDAWIKAAEISVTAEVIQRAKQTITRILSPPSELVDIWREGDHFEAWRNDVEALFARLG